MHNSHARTRSVARSSLVLAALALGCRAEEGASVSGPGGMSETGASTGEAMSTGVATGTSEAASGSSEATPTSGGPDLPPARACNGDAMLCERRFDEVAFPCTHNAFAARDDGFEKINANQRHGVAQQLADGVRCMMLDVSWTTRGTTVLCHGGCNLGRLEHAEVLADIAAFLDASTPMRC
jgi:hypothetical protein